MSLPWKANRPSPTPGALIAIRALSCAACLLAGCSTLSVDSVSMATSAIAERAAAGAAGESDILIILAASRGDSADMVAATIAEALGATVVSPDGLRADDLRAYSLIGFGSGIFDQAHHRALLALADGLPRQAGKKFFLFSTSGVSRDFALRHRIDDPHAPLRLRLQEKGFELAGEYNCAGFNDNSFLRLFGGMNKGKPDREDLEKASAFALELRAGLPD